MALFPEVPHFPLAQGWAAIHGHSSLRRRRGSYLRPVQPLLRTSWSGGFLLGLSTGTEWDILVAWVVPVKMTLTPDPPVLIPLGHVQEHLEKITCPTHLKLLIKTGLKIPFLQIRQICSDSCMVFN